MQISRATHAIGGAAREQRMTTETTDYNASGAVLHEDCPTRGGARRDCRCDFCAVCGYRKHTAIHGPLAGNGAGSRPWGHRYVEAGAVALAEAHGSSTEL